MFPDSYYSFHFVPANMQNMCMPNMMPNMAPNMMPNMGPNMMPNMAPNMMPNMGPNMMPNMAPNMMPNMGPNMMPNMAPNMMPNMGPNMMPNMGPNMMPNMVPDMMPDMMPDMSQEQPYMDFTDDMSEMDMGPATARPEDPPPVLSNNPPRTTIALFKELTGFPNYGNPSGNADILYTGNRGTWTFQLIPGLGEGNFRAQILIRGVLDDHFNVPENRYSATITVNDQRVHTGRLPLEHGRPAGSQFTNWRTLTFPIENLRRNNRVVIVNTSNVGPNDWIAFDWMELRLLPRR